MTEQDLQEIEGLVERDKPITHFQVLRLIKEIRRREAVLVDLRRRWPLVMEELEKPVPMCRVFCAICGAVDVNLDSHGFCVSGVACKNRLKALRRSDPLHDLFTEGGSPT